MIINNLYLGLILVPNGEDIGYALGDERPPNLTSARISSNRILSSISERNQTSDEHFYTNSHPWGVFFTILGTALLDFNADACQSPARAYLLDVTVTGKKFDSKEKLIDVHMYFMY